MDNITKLRLTIQIQELEPAELTLARKIKETERLSESELNEVLKYARGVGMVSEVTTSRIRNFYRDLLRGICK
jgi:hypothetical protein